VRAVDRALAVEAPKGAQEGLPVRELLGVDDRRCRLHVQRLQSGTCQAIGLDGVPTENAQAAQPRSGELFGERDDGPPRPVLVDLPDADIACWPGFFGPDARRRLFADLLATTAWRQDSITMYGKPVPIPRLQAWYGDPGRTYTYSNIEMVPEPWTPALLEVKAAIEPVAGVRFNSVLCNRYRHGNDGVAWHSDDEPELGVDPVIGSVSFGATRPFRFRHRLDPTLTHEIELDSGSLLIMRGPTQACWKHQIPKTAKPVGERVNLTFRVIVAPA
jgi:alkylated DNA repair dioxygenase AlkB